MRAAAIGRNYVRAIIAVVIVFFVAIASQQDRSVFAAQPADPSLGLDKEWSHWEKEVDRIGARAAYAEFRDYYTANNSSMVHALAHQLGDIIFNKDGLDGLDICDSAFGYACYHQFLARALAAYGVDVLPELGLHCSGKYRDDPRDCFHGIGHGLREYFGSDRLLDALRQCERFSQFRSCENGVFMDYNVPLWFNGTSTPYAKARPLDTAHPYAPCDTSVPDEYKISCYYSLPHLWPQYGGWDFDKIKQLCAGAPGNFASACYNGIPVDMVGNLNYDQTKIIAACATMPDSAKIQCISSTEYYVHVLGYDSCRIAKSAGLERSYCR